MGIVWRERLYWILALPLFWWAVVWVLRDASPVWEDGSGPMPSFHWGRSVLLPSASEYHRMRSFYDREYSRPYWIAAGAITLLTALATWLGFRFFPRLRRRGFLAPCVLCIGVLFVMSAVSDAGGRVGWWHGPQILPTDALTFWLIARLWGSIAMLWGLVTLAEGCVGGSSKTTGARRN